MHVPYICTHLYPGLIENVIVTVTLNNDTSFTVTWTSSDLNYSYTVNWTNLNTGVMESYTVVENTNSYIVTGLNDTIYTVTVTATGECGMRTSDPVTFNVNGECI